MIYYNDFYNFDWRIRLQEPGVFGFDLYYTINNKWGMSSKIKYYMLTPLDINAKGQYILGFENNLFISDPSLELNEYINEMIVNKTPESQVQSILKTLFPYNELIFSNSEYFGNKDFNTVIKEFG